MSRAVGAQQKVHADLLELYLRSRAKEADATEKEDWTKILNITIPKLNRLRSMAEIQLPTRLVYVMALVGSEQDAPLASRAVTAMLVQHWGDVEIRKQLQMDAIRHATVTAVDQRRAATNTIAQQLRLGVRNAIGGVGLDTLGMAEWWDEDSIFIAGDEEKHEILREVENLAIQCEHNVSGERKLVIQAYVERNRMDTFVEDFLNWGISQLQGLPSTMFDAIPEQKHYSHIEKISPPDGGSHPPDGGSHRAEGRTIHQMEGTRQQLSQKQEHRSASSIIVGLRTVSSDEEGDKDDEHVEAGYASTCAGDERGKVRCKSSRRRKGKSGSPPRRRASSPGQPRRGGKVPSKLADVDGHHCGVWGKGIDDIDGLGRRHGPTDEEVLAHLETWTEKNESGSSSSSEEGRTKRRKYRNAR